MDDFKLGLAWAGVTQAQAEEAEREATRRFKQEWGGETMRDKIERLRRQDGPTYYPAPRSRR